MLHLQQAEYQPMSLFKSSIAASLAVFALSLAAPAEARVSPDRKSVDCLARTIYHEARGEGAKGQRAVGEVVINRVKSGQFGKTVCGVTGAKGQFAPRGPIREHDAWQGAQNIAVSLLSGESSNMTRGATHFHTTKVRPSWSKRFPQTARIGSHVFYRAH